MTLLSVTAKSTQVTSLDSDPRVPLKTTESRGRVRYYYAYYKNTTAAALADGSHIALCLVDAPARILPISRVYVTAMGAGRTMDIGNQEYVGANGVVVNDDVDALRDGVDVSAATSFQLDQVQTGLEVSGPTTILAKIIGGTFPINGEIFAHLLVVMD